MQQKENTSYNVKHIHTREDTLLIQSFKSDLCVAILTNNFSDFSKSLGIT